MALIEDLLELARAEAGQLTVKLDRVVLYDVVHDAVEEHRAAAQAAGLTLAHLDDGSKTILTTDPARVTQVLGNLLSNAIKYTPAGGHIEVATEMLERRDGAESGRLAIHVADDGPASRPKSTRRCSGSSRDSTRATSPAPAWGFRSPAASRACSAAT
jgi:signal transduction histidine kinase